ncbi:MAG: glycosyltransferase family 2 protein [Maritimibacter sp.]
MRIVLHIGLEHCGAERLQDVLDDKRGQLERHGVRYAQAPGKKNHTKLYMAITDPGHVDALRYARGFGTRAAQDRLRVNLARDLQAEIAKYNPDILVLSCHQLASLPNTTEIARLRALLLPLSSEIQIVMHVGAQAGVLARHYAGAVMEGRVTSLSAELALAEGENWRAQALKSWSRLAPRNNDFPELNAPPHWLDYTALVSVWEKVFGEGSLCLRAYDETLFDGEDAVDEIRDMIGIKGKIGKANTARRPSQPSLETLGRARQMSEIYAKLTTLDFHLPRQFWKRFLGEVRIPGAPLDPGALYPVSEYFEEDNAELLDLHPALTKAAMSAPAPVDLWAEPTPTNGFRATQYATYQMPRIRKITDEINARREAAKSGTNAEAQAAPNSPSSALTPVAEKLLSERAKENFHHLRGGRFAPHNRLGAVNEEELAAAFDEVPMRKLPKNNSGNVVVGCMKNEAPYILEWIAYHRMMGVDNFLIYTNDCTDGTDALLDRLQDMGIVQHRDNSVWKGNSPQQYALNKSLKEPLIKNAQWVIHIDVDEFINVRCGNGMLQDFLDRVPDATNVAMTWRLFGHNGVTKLNDALVIDQFDQGAPKYCPKPHTVWGFKTMTKNTGAYEKLSCHRPNKLRDGHKNKVKWVNGSGQEMTEKYHEQGWRSDLKTVGYDLLQLNHYALRSAESFLVKRQRGRALHVDRSIGINYWVRMDWGGNRDITIKRNIPRLRAELDRLMQDAELARLHNEGFAWHRAKADELHAMDEFKELYEQALETKLTELERVAFALALDMES